VVWLREAMAGTWAQVAQRSGAHYTQYVDELAERISSIQEDTVIFSHFVAINAVIGRATQNDAVMIASLDNCSVTTFDVSGGVLTLLETGGEADTLIR
jgi:broad specificity phosphatase PhoE